MRSKNQKEKKNKEEKIQKKRTKIHRIIALICLFLTGGLYSCGASENEQQTELVEVQEEQQTETKRAGDENAGNTEDKNTVKEDAAAGTQKRNKSTDSDVKNNQDTEDSGQDKEKTCYVHVCGAVTHPGVYELPAGSRMYEAIALAGGLTENAAGEGLNQAEKVEDGSRIYVPDKDEYAAGMQNRSETSGIVSEVPGGKGGSFAADTASVEDGKVNLNTATKEQLMTLSGIGEAKASAIISYRESHGRFQNIEELMQVEGIKDGVFRKVKDQIKV